MTGCRPPGRSTDGGADLCLLTGQDPFSLFVLGGIDDPVHRTVRPPRLIAVDDNGRTVRNQTECANLLLEAYRATLKAGQHEIPLLATPRQRVISEFQRRAAGLTQWDLRPERLVELLATLAEFLGLNTDDQGRSAVAAWTCPPSNIWLTAGPLNWDGSCTSLKQGLATRLKPQGRSRTTSPPPPSLSGSARILPMPRRQRRRGTGSGRRLVSSGRPAKGNRSTS